MVRAEYIVFWILILAIVGIVIWLAFGSPDFESSLLSIVIFVAVSEILLWKAFFYVDKKFSVGLANLDKKTALGFERVKSDFREVNNKLENIGKEVREIKNLVSVKRRR